MDKYLAEFNQLLKSQEELQNDRANVKTEAGAQAIETAAEKVENRLYEMRHAKFIQVTSGKYNVGEFFEVIRERRGNYITWESETDPDGSYNWVSQENATEVKNPFDIAS